MLFACTLSVDEAECALVNEPCVHARVALNGRESVIQRMGQIRAAPSRSREDSKRTPTVLETVQFCWGVLKRVGLTSRSLVPHTKRRCGNDKHLRCSMVWRGYGIPASTVRFRPPAANYRPTPARSAKLTLIPSWITHRGAPRRAEPIQHRRVKWPPQLP